MYIHLFILFTVGGVTQQKELPCKYIRQFVDGHNNRRMRLAAGEIPGQPAAGDLKLMFWHEELAEKAMKRASKHTHDLDPDRTIPSGKFEVGENILIYTYFNEKGIPDLEKGLDVWFNEHLNYTYGPLEVNHFKDNSKMIGHYTQMAWANTSYIGCGMSRETRNKTYLWYITCFYGPPGNFIGETPYKRCEKAPCKLRCSENDKTKCNKMYGKKCS